MSLLLSANQFQLRGTCAKRRADEFIRRVSELDVSISDLDLRTMCLQEIHKEVLQMDQVWRRRHMRTVGPYRSSSILPA